MLLSRRLTPLEMQEYVRDKMNGLDISTDYLSHVKADLKRNSERQMNAYHKDHYAFLDEIFFDRTEELKTMQRILHNVISNTEDEEIKIKAVSELTGITTLLSNYYQQLPGMSQLGASAFQTGNRNGNNENNPLVGGSSHHHKTDIADDGSYWCTRCNILRVNDPNSDQPSCLEWKV